MCFKEGFKLLIEEFNQLNLQVGDKIKVTYDKYLNNTREWKTKEVTHKWLVTEIKTTVLSPKVTELCLYDFDGGFLPINKIKKIVKMKDSKYSPDIDHDICFDKSIFNW